MCDWLTDQPTNWPRGSLADQQTQQLTNWLTDRLTDWQINQPTDQETNQLTDWSTVEQIDKGQRKNCCASLFYLPHKRSADLNHKLFYALDLDYSMLFWDKTWNSGLAPFFSWQITSRICFRDFFLAYLKPPVHKSYIISWFLFTNNISFQYDVRLLNI